MLFSVWLITCRYTMLHTRVADQAVTDTATAANPREQRYDDITMPFKFSKVQSMQQEPG